MKLVLVPDAVLWHLKTSENVYMVTTVGFVHTWIWQPRKIIIPNRSPRNLSPHSCLPTNMATRTRSSGLNSVILPLLFAMDTTWGIVLLRVQLISSQDPEHVHLECMLPQKCIIGKGTQTFIVCLLGDDHFETRRFWRNIYRVTEGEMRHIVRVQIVRYLTGFLNSVSHFCIQYVCLQTNLNTG